MRTRAVFFCHGIDRRGARFFHHVTKAAARRRDGVLVGQLDGDTWSVMGGVKAQVTVLDWTDLIETARQRPWTDRIRASYHHLWLGLRQGFFGRIRRLDWGLWLMLIWGFWPMVVLPALALIGFAHWSAWILAVLVGAVLWQFDRRLGIGHVQRIAWMCRRLALRDDPQIEQRFAQFLSRIKASDADEIVLIGHSVGAVVAAQLCAAFRRGDTRPITLVTLGQSIPLVSCQAEAAALRADLVAPDPLTDWVDVSSRKDILGAFGIDPSHGRMRRFTARFEQVFGTARVERVRGVAMHYLYVQPILEDDLPWDFLGMQSGDIPVAARFAEAPLRRSGGGRTFPV